MKRKAGGHGPTLADQVEHQLLPTPAARDWKSGQSNLIGTNARPLNEVVEMLLPTPMAADGRLDRGPGRQRGEGQQFGLRPRNTSREILRGEPMSPRSVAGRRSSAAQHPGQLSLDEQDNASPQGSPSS